MALWWCGALLSRLGAVWLPLLLSLLLWHMSCPVGRQVHAATPCPRSCTCPGVKEVHCTFRHLTAIPKTLPKDTERVNLGYNSLTAVEGSEFRSLRQLEMLMLHGNDISTVHPGAFYPLRSLQILKLSYNKLTTVNPGLLEGLVGLVRLHLDHNLIHFIEPYSFSGLASLKLLQLEGNLLKEVHPHTFITLSLLGAFWTSGLRHLHLSDNLLERLPDTVLQTAPRLELLSLHGNPWTCDCQLHWLLEWNSRHDGVIKCKKERGSSEMCPQCTSPQVLNGSAFLDLTPDKLPCERPVLRSPLKQWDSPVWAESEVEPDLPYTRDLERPLGHLTFVLSDSHGNNAHVACDVRRPSESSLITWTESPRTPGEVTVNTSLVTVLECEIDRESLQNLWRLVAYYYESPAILERGLQRGNDTRATYQYSQAVNENSPYFTDLKGYLMAEPSWLLQPKVTLQLNRRQTTTKKLVMDFTTLISKQTSSRRGLEADSDDTASSWALIRRGAAGRVKATLEGSKVNLECEVITAGLEVKVEWMLPDLSIFEDANDKMDISERGELIILNATASDSGLYHCLVRTKAGVDLVPVRLTVKEQLLIPTALNGQKLIVEKGHSISLPCEVTSAQPSKTTWYLPRNQILLPTQQTRRAEVLENGTLVVKKLTQDDAGEYSCMASNLYGVDMLSHMIEVTGEKETEGQTESGRTVLLVGEEEGEGSGEDFQEIKQSFATQAPKMAGTQQRTPGGFVKGRRMKDSKRKPNMSVKKLDPHRWAEILAKANARVTTAQPTVQLLTEPSSLMTTVMAKTTTPKPTTTIVITNAVTTNLSPTTSLDMTTKPLRVRGKSEEHSREKVKDLDEVNRHSGEGRVSSKPASGLPNRRRPPYGRRRPPMRGVLPRLKPSHPSRNSQTTLPQPTTMRTTPTTTPTTTTTSTTTTTTTTTGAPTTTEQEEVSNEYDQTQEEIEYDDEEYDEDVEDSFEEKEITDLSDPLHVTEDSGDIHTKNNSRPAAGGVPHDTEMTVEEHEEDSEEPNKGRSSNSRKQMEEVGNQRQEDKGETDKFNKERDRVDQRPDGGQVLLKATDEREQQSRTDKEGREREAGKATNVTESYIIRQTTQNRPLPFPKPPQEKDRTPTHAVTSISNAVPSQENVLKPSHTDGDKTRQEGEWKEEEEREDEKSKIRAEIPAFPGRDAIHPWLHPDNQRGGQIPSSRTVHPNPDRDGKNKKKKGEEGDGRFAQLPHIAPTPYRPSTHHQHHHHYPFWPGQRSFPRPDQEPGWVPVPTHQPWLQPHLWGQGSRATNRPEITAETVRPTAGGPGRSGLKPTTPYHNYHNAGGGTHVIPGGKTSTRDHLLLTKLRNRYRQAQLERIAQLGRRVTFPLTPKPETIYPHSPSSNEPKTHLPPSPKSYAPEPPGPTVSYPYTLKPPKPASPTTSASTSSSSFGLSQINFPHPYTTPAVMQGGRWTSGGRSGSWRPTAVPRFPGLMGTGGGIKPRITTVTRASVSVLAESDVFMSCEASGNPSPNLAWTKVSTGATIPANTKHGLRFEVFKNGTFVIKNVQLQDRGQYLCTAQNRLGSDRMVITLAVQTQAPKIIPPKSTEIAVYLGKGVSLDCLASGKPPAHISWILPDRTYVRDVGAVQAHLSVLSLLHNGTLRIQSANFSSKGDYKCIASNAAGADTITYHLHVAALPPSISEGATDTVIIQPGRSVYVHCSAKGEPEPVLKWMLPAGVAVKPSQFLGRRLFVFPNGTLYIKSVSPADAGRYECSATNPVGVAKRTLQLEVRADLSALPAAPPSSRYGAVPRPSQHHSVSAMYGSTVYLHCPESTGSARGTVWQLPSKMIMEHRYSPQRPVTVFPNGTLRISQLTELDGGNYLCVFQRPNGEDMELFQVEVLMTPPRIKHLRTPQATVTYGQNFQVDCVATGLPDPEVSWSLPDGTFINNALQSDDSGLRNRRYVIFGNGTLLLQQMGKKDEGDYTCYAKNKLGKDERKVSVKVAPDVPQISLKSQSLVTARLGEAAKLSCQASGDPRPRIMWISPGNEVISASSDRYQVLYDGMLVVKRVTLSDQGKYACVARNPAGDDIKHMHLEVESQEPRIDGVRGERATKVLAVSYQTTMLDCRAEGKPEPRVSWATPYGLSLPTPYLGGRFQVHRNGSMELRGVRKTDAGRYVCLAKNRLGEASLLVDLEVASLAEKPSFATPNIEILPIKQDSGELTLECPARGKPHPDFLWILPNGKALTPGVRLPRFTHHLGNGTLRISQPVASDKGVYRCVAKNVAGQAEKQYALEAGRKPLIRGTPGAIKIAYGQSLNLPCSVDGWPQATVTWTLPNGLVVDKIQTVGRVSFLANGTLQLREVATFDRGTYTCKASNALGSSTLAYPVAVMVFPPRITSAPTSITRVSRGSPVSIRCVAGGMPKPDISWTLPGRTTLVPHNRFSAQGGIHMTEEGSLVIQNPVLTHSGIYKCNARNALGTDFKATYLQVN